MTNTSQHIDWKKPGRFNRTYNSQKDRFFNPETRDPQAYQAQMLGRDELLYTAQDAYRESLEEYQ